MFEKKIFVQRQSALIEKVKNSLNCQNGAILLFSGFEIDSRHKFRPDNNFFYLTGIKEPGVCALINLDKISQLFTPEYAVNRSIWESESSDKINTEKHGFDKLCKLGKPINGFDLSTDFGLEQVEDLVFELKKYDKIFLCPNMGSSIGQSGLSAKWFYNKIISFLGKDYVSKIFNIADQISDLRRIKDESEMSSIMRSIQACLKAQKKVAPEIIAGKTELELKNSISQFYDDEKCADKAFRSIVASGKNSTVLHHTPSHKRLESVDLVVVDIGCEFDMYASDITRTYPVSGKFSPRQKEIYQIVLDAQKFIESVAKPGMFLRNAEKKEASLQYLCTQFFKEKGLEKYFPHGVGHYMGLEVHDVGSYAQSLAPGCVFTIEPGLYIPDESIGVRIEDNYWIDSSGSLIRLSENLPREADEIEAIIKNKKH